MRARNFISYVVALVFFAVAAPGFALGQPPIHQDPEPGITVPQAI